MRLLPDVQEDEPVPANVRWLFDTGPTEPGVGDSDTSVGDPDVLELASVKDAAWRRFERWQDGITS